MPTTLCAPSPSSRRAWIEIRLLPATWPVPQVALLAEGVDRNHDVEIIAIPVHVALLAEGVDRNESLLIGMVMPDVALLAEGVDRNMSATAL